jgi:hypothetical protein
MIRRSCLARQLILLSSALCLATVAAAGLKEKPPKGVQLSSTWQLDPYRSDDPTAVLDKAREDMRASGGGVSRRGGANRGVFGSGRRGGGFPGGGGGGGFPGGGGGHRHGGTPPDDDSSGGSPSGGTQSGSAQPGGARSGGSRGQLFSDLGKNPDRLTFQQVDRNLKVSADDTGTECAPGVKVAISDSLGDGERNCGWDGRAWVIETTRGKNFTRTDRYELSKDGKTLTYVTTATGTRLPKIKISRTYTAAPAAVPSTATTVPGAVGQR